MGTSLPKAAGRHTMDGGSGDSNAAAPDMEARGHFLHVLSVAGNLLSAPEL